MKCIASVPRGLSPSLSSQSHRLELPSLATDIFGGIQSPWHCPIGRLAPPPLSSISLRAVTRTSLPRSSSEVMPRPIWAVYPRPKVLSPSPVNDLHRRPSRGLASATGLYHHAANHARYTKRGARPST